MQEVEIMRKIIFSIFAGMDIAPSIGLKGVLRIIAIAIWTVVIESILPQNTLLARFAKYNCENYNIK